MGQRLIDAAEARRRIIAFATGLHSEVLPIDTVMMLLTQAPTVDAVTVIRCSECKHWKKEVVGCTENVGRCEYANYFVGASGYCVYGDREKEIANENHT